MGSPIDTSSGVIGSVTAEPKLIPSELAAVTEQVYGVSLVNPVTVMGEVELWAVTIVSPSEQLASYPVIAAPPSSLTEIPRMMVPSS
jgi:hypothetical protein